MDVPQFRGNLRGIGLAVHVIEGDRPLAAAQFRSALRQVIVHLAVAVGELVEQLGSVGKMFHYLVLVGLFLLQGAVQFTLRFAALLAAGRDALGEQGAEAQAYGNTDERADDEDGQAVHDSSL